MEIKWHQLGQIIIRDGKGELQWGIDGTRGKSVRVGYYVKLNYLVSLYLCSQISDMTLQKKLFFCHLQVVTCTKAIHVANSLPRVNGHVCEAW
jgi:hypothetical protein